MKDGAVVRKSNALIEARYRLTLAEQRIILMLASTVRETDKDFKPYRFTVKELVRLTGSDSKSAYKEIHEIIRQLVHRVVRIENEDGNYTLTHWVGSASYFRGEGAFELSFSPKLKPHLLELASCYKQYQLNYALQLKSKYSVRMYELLKQYENIGKRTFELQKLRAALGLKEEEYKTTTYFKDRILETAKKELPKCTDLKFTYRRIMKQRCVWGYEFSIKANEDKKPKKSSPIQETKNSAIRFGLESIAPTDAELIELNTLEAKFLTTGLDGVETSRFSELTSRRDRNLRAKKN